MQPQLEEGDIVISFKGIDYEGLKNKICLIQYVLIRLIVRFTKFTNILIQANRFRRNLFLEE